jgi:NADH pyrophosphatase NudC (nudix superfamily)
LLGWFRGERCVLVELRDADAARGASGGPNCANCGRWRRCCRPDSASLLAYARALACGRRGIGIAACAGAQCPARPGTSCAAARGMRHRDFPALDPAIIVLVTDATASAHC